MDAPGTYRTQQCVEAFKPHLPAAYQGNKALAAHGLVRTGLFGEHRCPPGTFGVSADLGSAGGSPFDYALVCCKSCDSEPAAAQLARHGALLGDGVRVVLFQNGYGNVEVFSAALGPERMYAARVSHRIDADLWAKILYNARPNPLGAVLDATYGELGASAEARRIMERIAAEGYAAMEASGHRTHWSDAGAFLRAFYEEMLPPTREHKSSMLQSLRAGRRTEVEALNGALARLGREHGLATPCNDLVAALMRHLEARGSVSRPAPYRSSSGLARPGAMDCNRCV